MVNAYFFYACLSSLCKVVRAVAENVSVLDLTSVSSVFVPNPSLELHGGFADASYGYLVLFSNNNEMIGVVARFLLGTFNNVEVLDLTETEPRLKGFWGGFTDGVYGYLAPAMLGVVARFNLHSFSNVTALDLTRTSRQLKEFRGGFTDGSFGYLVPNQHTTGIVRFALDTFDDVNVLHILEDLNKRAQRGFDGGFSDHTYGYLIPRRLMHFLVRFSLRDFESVELLDLSVIGDFNGNSGNVGFAGGFYHGNFGYLVPHETNKDYVGCVARFSLHHFTDVDNLSILDVSVADPNLVGFRDGFAFEHYGYLVPYAGLSGLLTRFELSTFNGVTVLNISQIDSTLKGFSGSFLYTHYSYLVPSSYGSVARVDLQSVQFSGTPYVLTYQSVGHWILEMDGDPFVLFNNDDAKAVLKESVREAVTQLSQLTYFEVQAANLALVDNMNLCDKLQDPCERLLKVKFKVYAIDFSRAKMLSKFLDALSPVAVGLALNSSIASRVGALPTITRAALMADVRSMAVIAVNEILKTYIDGGSFVLETSTTSTTNKTSSTTTHTTTTGSTPIWKDPQGINDITYDDDSKDSFMQDIALIGVGVIALCAFCAVVLVIRRRRRRKLSHGGSDVIEILWEDVKEKWPFVKRNESMYSTSMRKSLVQYLPEPKNWSICWEGLLQLDEIVESQLGEQYDTSSMYDVVQEVVKPSCAKSGAPIALVMNDWNVTPVDDFVTHCWAENFSEFMNSLEETYRLYFEKPNLFICGFTIYQGTPEDIASALGNAIEDAPFVRTLRTARNLTVLRNSTCDLFERGWCVLELIYAKKFSIFPNRALIAGPDTFSTYSRSVLDLKCSDEKDRQRILSGIIHKTSDVKAIDLEVAQIRSFTLSPRRAKSTRSQTLSLWCKSESGESAKSTKSLSKSRSCGSSDNEKSQEDHDASTLQGCMPDEASQEATLAGIDGKTGSLVSTKISSRRSSRRSLKLGNSTSSQSAELSQDHTKSSKNSTQHELVGSNEKTLIDL